mgnify:CR=1 FL=1
MKKKIISFLMVMVICLTMPGCFDMAPGGGKVKACLLYTSDAADEL